MIRSRLQPRKIPRIVGGTLSLLLVLVPATTIVGAFFLTGLDHLRSLYWEGVVASLLALVSFTWAVPTLRQTSSSTYRNFALGFMLVPLAAPAALWLLLSQPAPPSQQALQKNVILIGVDTLRWDHTSLSIDAARDLTPNLRAWSQHGTRFENAISQAPWTLPAFASVMTGRYPRQHGATSLFGSLREEEVTLAEVLREEGYRTAAIISNLFVDSERRFRQGFDRFSEDHVRGHDAITSRGVTDEAPCANNL